MERLTKKEQAEVDEMINAITSADRRLAAGKIKPSEHEEIIRGIRERQNLMRIRKTNSLTTPIAELTQEEYNRAYTNGYQSGFNEGLRIRLTGRTNGNP